MIKVTATTRPLAESVAAVLRAARRDREAVRRIETMPYVEYRAAVEFAHRFTLLRTEGQLTRVTRRGRRYLRNYG